MADRVRKFPGVTGPRPDLKSLRKGDEAKRNEEWASLSLQDQLKELDRKHGKGEGARHQRSRILLSMEMAKQAPVRADSGPTEKPESETKGKPKEKAKDRRKRLA